jgi:hypothetical protein
VNRCGHTAPLLFIFILRRIPGAYTLIRRWQQQWLDSLAEKLRLRRQVSDHTDAFLDALGVCPWR